MSLYRADKRAEELRQICLEELAIHPMTREIARLEIVPAEEDDRSWDAVDILNYEGEPAAGETLRAARETIDLQRDLFSLAS